MGTYYIEENGPPALEVSRQAVKGRTALHLDSFTGLQITGLLLVIAGALLTFVFSPSGGTESQRRTFGLKAAGLVLAAAGALLVLI